MTPARPGTTKATVTPIDDRSARIERIFNAPRDRVWRAYTEPALVAQWWGRGNPLTVERLDVVKGGHWRFVEHSDHGTHGFEGRFSEVEPPARLAYTFEWDGMPGHVMLDDLTLEDLGDGRTRAVIISTAMRADDLAGMMASGMEEGMNASYAALDRLLDAMASGTPLPTADAPATVRPAATVPTVDVKAGTGTAMHVLVGPEQGDTGFALRRFIMQPGGGMPLHTNLVEHQQYVLRGKARITIGSAVHEVAPDHTLFIPAGVPHSYDVVEGPFEFICVVPDRPDKVTLVGAC
jgi:uncharacterized protein YndB with AHSA1/START domain/quercetin dioxygenase-like cupin family protein